MGRPFRLVTACALATAAMVAVPAARSVADTPDGSAYSAAAKVTPAGTLAPQVSTDGLLSFLSPVLSAVVNPLTSTLGALPTQLLASVAGGLTGAGLEASNGSAQQAAPASGLADCTAGGWTASNCYGPVLPAISAPPLLTLSTGVTRGFATGDASGYTARAEVGNPVISLLGLNVGNLGVIDAEAHCPATGTCTAQPWVSGISLLGGLVTADVAKDTGLLSASVAGHALADGVSVPITTGISSLGLNTVSVLLNENLLTVKLGIGLDQLLDGLGLGGLLSGVAGLADGGSSAFVTLTVGPGKQVSGSTSAQAWGLEVGVDLTATISLSLLGLAGVTITVPSGIDGSSYGNVLDLKLAYANAFSGNLPNPGPQWIPPGLI